MRTIFRLGIWSVIIYCIIQFLVMKHNKDPGDDQYIIKDTELDYDAWEKDKKGPMPDTTIKPDTTPYKGKWVDVN